MRPKRTEDLVAVNTTAIEGAGADEKEQYSSAGEQ